MKRLKNDNNIVILPADKGRVTVVMDKTDYFDKMDALLLDKRTYKELNTTRRQHFNVNLITKYLRLKRLKLLTLNATIDCGAQYHNHRNFTDYRNCTSLVYRCDL